MARRPHVALMIETAGAYGRNLLQGITRYHRMHRMWSIFLERRELDSVSPRWLETWQGDGILTRWSSPRVVELLAGIQVPVVDLSGRRGPFGPPRIHCDDRAIGRLAAEHFLQRGLRAFGFCGFSGEFWSIRRREGFATALDKAGSEVPGLRNLVARAQRSALRGRSAAPRDLAGVDTQAGGRHGLQ